jgi:hypothetical protein
VIIPIKVDRVDDFLGVFVNGAIDLNNVIVVDDHSLFNWQLNLQRLV